MKVVQPVFGGGVVVAYLLQIVGIHGINLKDFRSKKVFGISSHIVVDQLRVILHISIINTPTEDVEVLERCNADLPTSVNLSQTACHAQ